VGSPETVVAYALAGTLDFDPRTDSLRVAGGTAVRLAPPSGWELPAAGFATGDSGVVAPPPPAERGAHTPVVAPGSERLQLLEPFPAWHGGDLVDLAILAKARGKTTTDQISPAGPWLRYRGHLERMSANLFSGVVNAFTGAVGTGRDSLDGETRPFPEIARRLADAGIAWCVIGDDNYGEGSSREHAAMEPRFRGCVAILARSFARIHETNLKKQGVLALTFADAADYERIGEQDVISIVDLASLAPGVPVRALVTSPDGDLREITLHHSLSAEQIEWFAAGSALNVIRQQPANI
jgi:aconitate hydratase